MFKKRKFIIYLSIVVGLVVGIWFAVSKPQNETGTNQEQSLLTKLRPQASPTTAPFAEMTIPYLRQREYISQLAELSPFNNSSEFTSYLTSYDSDGLRINALLTIPDGEMPAGGWPAVVFIHGYIPPSIYRTEEKYEDYVNSLARNDLVVLKIDLRGHDESEGDAGGAYYAGDYIIDALNARAALQDVDFVNPDKIGLWGHSMAGNVVLRAMAARPEIKAGVIWAGSVYTYEDFQEFGIDDNSYRPPTDDSPRRERRNNLFETHGQFDPEDEFWQQVPATNYLDDFTGAVQLHHAVNDDVVGIGYSRNLAEILDLNSVNHEFYEYGSGGHNLSSPAFSTAMSRTVEFFDRYLK